MQVTNSGKGVVLIIDDDRMIVDLVKMAFAGDGYQVVAAQSGNELGELLEKLDSTRNFPFDLILLDLLLPDVSGEELYRRLRSNPQITKIPIIILSAAAAVQKRIQLLKMGADDYIIKPFNVDDLLMRATVHIKLGKMRQAKHEAENRIDLLGEIAQMINSAIEPENILTATLERLKNIIQVESGFIFLPETNPDEEGQTAGLLNARDNDLFLAPQNDGQGLVADVLRSGEPCIVNDVQKDSRFTSQFDQTPGVTTNSLICVPLNVRGQSVCVIQLINKLNDEFTASDLSLVVSAANIISVAMDNAQLHQMFLSDSQKSVLPVRPEPLLVQEIGMPLQTVRSYLERALHAKLEPEKHDEYLQMASIEVERLINAVNVIQS
jgi:CheY-like chemotaxis protein